MRFNQTNTITGTAQSDPITGTSANEIINAKAGNDYINGKGGDDTISGGAGVDQFGLEIGGGHDVITDYRAGEELRFGFGAFPPLPDSGLFQETDPNPSNFGAGDTRVTDTGHVLTGSLDGHGSLVLSWDTGDSFTLQGVSSVSTAAFHFVPVGWLI